jgi:hypothetical protein
LPIEKGKQKQSERHGTSSPINAGFVGGPWRVKIDVDAKAPKRF